MCVPILLGEHKISNHPYAYSQEVLVNEEERAQEKKNMSPATRLRWGMMVVDHYLGST